MIIVDIHKTLQAAGGPIDLGIRFEMEAGQIVTFFGDSGAGKTSLLRMLAGLMNPESGKITMNGKDWFDSDRKINLIPQHRNIGYVFQDDALFPHMTVRQNLEFAQGKAKDRKIISDLIDIMELGALQDRKPGTLSGGQKQRVALARALVQKPGMLLLDEPLAALDIKTRLKLQDYLLSVHKEYQLTTILVSHDIGEVIRLSDKVYRLNNGEIFSEGSPDEIFVKNKISGKFKFKGEVLSIEKQEVVYIVEVLIQTNVVKVVAQESEITGLQPGDQVVVASKAFNPIIYKVDT